MLFSIGIVSTLLLCADAAKNFVCNPYGIFSLELTAGSKDLIYSVPRGAPYSGEKNCYYNISCPVGFDVHINCPFVNLPESPDCSRDYLLVMTDRGVSQRHCGQESFQATSNGTNLGVIMVAPKDTTGGLFVCQLSCLLSSWPAFTKHGRFLNKYSREYYYPVHNESSAAA